jgi:hypothetical protein
VLDTGFLLTLEADESRSIKGLVLPTAKKAPIGIKRVFSGTYPRPDPPESKKSRPRWEQGRPTAESDLRLAGAEAEARRQGLENIKPTKSRSTPARLDNVSFFPSPIVSVDPFPDFPPLPDFLDRRKAKQATEAAA